MPTLTAPNLNLSKEYDRVAHKLGCVVVVPARARQGEIEREMRRVMERFVRDMALQGYTFLKWLKPSPIEAYYDPLELPKARAPRPFRMNDLDGWRQDETHDREAASRFRPRLSLLEADGWQFAIYGLFAGRPALVVTEDEGE